MNNLLIFFALPVATIILASVFERIIESPVNVALTAFAIYLIVTFAFFDESFLIATFVYTVLAYISALITRIIQNWCNNNSNTCLVNVVEGLNSNNNDDLRCRMRR